MIPARFKTQIIVEDADQYDVPKSVEATFVNQGDTPVEIQGFELQKGEPLKIGSSGTILQETKVNIEFIVNPGIEQSKKLVLIYNAPINC